MGCRGPSDREAAFQALIDSPCQESTPDLPDAIAAFDPDEDIVEDSGHRVVRLGFAVKAPNCEILALSAHILVSVLLGVPPSLARPLVRPRAVVLSHRKKPPSCTNTEESTTSAGNPSMS